MWATPGISGVWGAVVVPLKLALEVVPLKLALSRLRALRCSWTPLSRLVSVLAWSMIQPTLMLARWVIQPLRNLHLRVLVRQVTQSPRAHVWM